MQMNEAATTISDLIRDTGQHVVFDRLNRLAVSINSSYYYEYSKFSLITGIFLLHANRTVSMLVADGTRIR